MPKALLLAQPGMADWEYGPVLPVLKEYFSFDMEVATPDGEPVLTMGGLSLAASASFEDADILGADLVLLIGSGAWIGYENEFLLQRIAQRVEAGRPVSAICAATLVLARAGVLNARPHTSNAVGFLRENAPAYSGQDAYRDVAHAVSDGLVATAPGSAPASFAVASAALVHPERAADVVGYWNMARGEFEVLGTELGSIFKA